MTQTTPDADPAAGRPDGAIQPGGGYGLDQMRGVLLTVERIAQSGLLGQGPRLEAILRYIVREELEGRGDRLKAYSIATEVLQRPTDFDPATDSIVRVEMGRLRKALDHYAASADGHAAVGIALDKGSYRPRFTMPGLEWAAPPARPARWPTALLALAAGLIALGVAAWFTWTGPRGEQAQPTPVAAAAPAPEVLLLPVVNAGPAEWHSLARQLRFDLASFLAGQPWLNVHLAESHEAARRMAQAQAQSSTYALEVDLVADDGTMKLLVSLMNAPSLRVVWTRSYPLTPTHEGLSHAASEVARSVASDVAVVNGVIGQAEIDRLAGRDPVTAEQQRCLLLSSAFWRDYSGTLRKNAEECLEAAVRQDAAFADGLAALSLLQIDLARSDPSPERSTSLARAAQLAERALAGRRSASILPETARLAVLACQGDAAMIVAQAKALVALRPTSDAVLQDAANKVSLAAGEWGLGATWLRQAGQGSIAPASPSVALAPMVAAILAQDARGTLAAVAPIQQFDFLIGQVLRAAAAARAGDSQTLADAEDTLARLGHGDRSRRIDLVRAQCWREDIRNAVMDFVQNAPR